MQVIEEREQAFNRNESNRSIQDVSALDSSSIITSTQVEAVLSSDGKYITVVRDGK
jgi:hypothetical protein